MKKKLKNKNLLKNPERGGIPAIDKKINTIVIDIKLCLLKPFKSLKVFNFCTSKIKITENTPNNKNT
jgi:hypothetical protein